MDFSQDLTIILSNTIVEIGENIAEIENLKHDFKISQQEYYKKIYLEIEKIDHLKSAIGRAEQQGIKFNERQIIMLDDIIDSLYESTDIPKMDEISPPEEILIQSFDLQYPSINPDRCLEDLVNLN